jgi:hypothetical protein
MKRLIQMTDLIAEEKPLMSVLVPGDKAASLLPHSAAYI